MRRFPRGLEGMELLIGIVILAILLCVLAAPYTLPAGSVTDLSGKVGSVDNSHQISDMNPFAQAFYYFGDVNCHQIAERSYYLNGNEMPVCARDLGILIGLPIALFLLAYVSFRPKIWMVIVLLAPMALDGGLQYLTDYTSFNELRLLTGLLGGAAAAMFLAIAASMALGLDEKVKDRSSG